MLDNNLYNKAYKFALEIVNIYKDLSSQKKEFVLSKQLLKCGTSIGANVAEANGAISKTEFSSKISIAYKECLETKYWLLLLKDTGFISIENFDKLYKNAEELSKILFSIIKTTRIKNSDQ
ncbi:MAG: four helix bundle protein [Elusimicrobia bacterium]|nr:four helix bundle protein [Candidatus Liberimonas magnetica]